LADKVPGPLGKNNKHFAVLWLFRLVDNKDGDFTLPIYKTDNPDRLTQNVVDESDDAMTLEKVGDVKFSARFKPGLDKTHSEVLKDHDHWSTYQSWLAAKESGEAKGESRQPIDA